MNLLVSDRHVSGSSHKNDDNNKKKKLEDNRRETKLANVTASER